MRTLFLIISSFLAGMTTMAVIVLWDAILKLRVTREQGPSAITTINERRRRAGLSELGDL